MNILFPFLKDMFLYCFCYFFLLLFQYGVGEVYLIGKMKRRNIGYYWVVFFQLFATIFCTYLIVFTEYIDFLGVAFMLLTFYFFYKFIERMRNKHE